MKNVIVSLIAISFLFEAQALADQMYGILMVVKGSVKIQNASKQSTDAKVGSKVQVGDTIITGEDARAKVVMSDRNVINVNPNTQVVISAYKNDAATGEKNVELNLLQGKVRNNVEQTYDGEKSKFLIKTPTAVAGVRGTQFLAGFDPGTRMTSIVTFKGAVSLASIGANGKVIGAPVMVKKGQMTHVAPNAIPENPKAVPKEDLKKMDGDSTATAQNKDSRDSKGSKESKNSKDKDSKDASNSKEKRETASEGLTTREPVPTSQPSMVDSRDMDASQATSINIPTAAPAVTPPPINKTPAPISTPNPYLIPQKSNVNVRIQN
ncbi:MAG: FecR family protein [Pseudobdellovibrionaceae bacterium]